MSAVGTALGPSMGGLLIASLNWRAIFLVNMPLGILTFFLAWRYLPMDRRGPNTVRPGFDIVGTFLLALTLAAALGLLHGAWWWAQGSVVALGLLAIGLLSWSYRIEPHPFAILLRRFGVVTVGTWALLTAALATTERLPDMPPGIADIGSMVWYVFLSSMLLLVPYRARSQSLMREFSLLAAISTVATSLDLLFVALFSFGAFASLTLDKLPGLFESQRHNLSLRWAHCKSYWFAMTGAASVPESRNLRRAQLFGLQVAAAARLSGA